MNSVNLIGRLTKDIELRYTQAQMAVARFSIAIDRGKDKEGNDKGADFPVIVVFGKAAENCERYLSKGRKVAVQGRIQTDSYKKEDGTKVFKTEVIADRVEFIDWGEKAATQTEVPAGFQAIDDYEDIPF